MAPKKKETQKMSLGDFLSDQNFGGSWADEVEDTYGTQPLPPAERRSGYGSGSGMVSGWERNYVPRDTAPAQIPDKPPFTAHLGNLSYDATNETVTEFFAGCEIISVRIIEDREQQRPKGFAYAEFAHVEGLKAALDLDGQNFQGRTIRIKVADPPRDRDGRGESTRDLSDWTRKGPLADLPGRGSGNDRRPSEFGERRGPPREHADDGKVRDFGNWERKGPLSPLAQPEPPVMTREGSRPRTNDGRQDSFRGPRRESPAAWGEGQGPARQEGSRPPRRDIADRPERVPSAAEKDMQWRSSMRPDAPAKASPGQSRDGSEAPPSPTGPSPAPAPGPAVRPKLNLQKRTVSEATTEVASPAVSDSKASPFGAARPIDTAQREREIEEKRQQHLKEKREAEEKAKEERRLAKEAAAKEAAEKAAKAEEEAVKAANATEEQETGEATDEVAKEDGQDKVAENGASTEQKLPVRSKGPRENIPPVKRPSDSGNWRQASGELRSPRGPPTGPRRGGGPPRGPRHEGQRPARSNGSPAAAQPPTPSTETPPATKDEDGWTTVPNKGRRGRA